mmetsp:Transcript_62144/g.128881  ORF Transcript_62144/g.128881 Transcript_62144/m.128881 type:complete len:214 (+) Transcript_62144:3521-4162(+)
MMMVICESHSRRKVLRSARRRTAYGATQGGPHGQERDRKERARRGERRANHIRGCGNQRGRLVIEPCWARRDTAYGTTRRGQHRQTNTHSEECAGHTFQKQQRRLFVTSEQKTNSLGRSVGHRGTAEHRRGSHPVADEARRGKPTASSTGGAEHLHVSARDSTQAHPRHVREAQPTLALRVVVISGAGDPHSGCRHDPLRQIHRSRYCQQSIG